MPPVSDEEFSALMAPLGPFEPAPRLAAAVSGGADSLSLALLAARWARAQGGNLLALVVDHRLRPESGREAAETAARLAAHHIPARTLELMGLIRGPGLAERARTARYSALLDACRDQGILHLLLGHHAADQAETVIMRALSASGPAGLAGMSGIVETTFVRLLRPLLTIPPVRLRETLIAAGVPWAEDPSNTDRAALRPRLRALRADRHGEGPATAGLVAAAAGAAQRRAEHERETAALLARVTLRPEGFALLDRPHFSADLLGALVQAVSGAEFPPDTKSIAALASAPRPATLGGARLMAGGRMGGMLIVRETAAMQPPVPARPGTIWDRRFRLGQHARLPADAMLGALGDDAARMRRRSDLPAVVLRTLPAVRQGGQLIAVPHLDYPDAAIRTVVPVLFAPARPVATAPFFAA